MPRAGSIRLASAAVTPSSWLEAHESFETTVDSSEHHAVEVTIDAGPAMAGPLRSGVVVLTIKTSNVTEVLVDGGERRRQVKSLDRCDKNLPCTIGFSARGAPGQVVRWSVDAFMGYFDGSPVPDAATITISEPRVFVN